MPESKNKLQLQLHPTPFKSSLLAIPPSPFSPRTPLALTSHPLPSHHCTQAYPDPDSSAHPPTPLQWVWQCHQCRRTYHLGVTRRCLDDGHHFCAGTIKIKTWRKPLRPARTKAQRACASEFDYQGWKTWGRWRRSGRKDSIYNESSSADWAAYPAGDGTWKRSGQRLGPRKDCWNACDYPSECRWGKHWGVRSPDTTEFPPAVEGPTATPPTTTATAMEGILTPTKDKKAGKSHLWAALVASATRRKNTAPSSPLASEPEEPDAKTPQDEAEDEAGDIFMETSAPAPGSQQHAPACSAAPSVAVALTASAPLVALKDIIRKSSWIVGTPSKPTEAKEQSTADPGYHGSSLTELPSETAHRGDVLAELAPLERASSSDSGYHSTQDESSSGRGGKHEE